MNILFFEIALVFYVLGTGLFLTSLAIRTDALSTFSIGTTVVGFLLHSASILTRIIEAGTIPLMSLYEVPVFFAWGLVLAFLIVEYKYRIPVLGSFILPLVVVAMIFAAAFPKDFEVLEPVLKNIWLHVSLTVLGTVAFAVAFVAGVMYLLQERLLKSKRFIPMYYKLPPLDFLDELNRKAILFGFPLLTLGIATGTVWANFVWGSYWTWDPKQISSAVTWLFYLIVLLGRVMVGWRAKRAAYLTIIGFGGVLATFSLAWENLLFEGSRAFLMLMGE